MFLSSFLCFSKRMHPDGEGMAISQEIFAVCAEPSAVTEFSRRTSAQLQRLGNQV